MTHHLHHIPNRTKPLPPLRVGIGGPVGCGKTTLLEKLCKAIRERYELIAITNDIYTKKNQPLPTLPAPLPPPPTTSTPRKTSACSPSAARCLQNASWAWKPAAAPTPPSAKTHRSTSKP